jgi:predicted amino acid racemase
MKMSYPRLEISLDKITHNTQVVIGICNRQGIRVAGVTKAFCGHPKIARAMVDGGIDILADSRLENLKKLREFPLPKLLLRLPMISQAKAVVECADISLNSEIDTIKALSEAAIAQRKSHKIILMFDLGDLREGIFDENELFHTVEQLLQLKGIILIGIGTNMTCFGGVIPTPKNLSKLTRQKRAIESRFNLHLEVVSGGNSSTLYLIEEGIMPDGINQLRLGESIVLGRETAFGRQLEGTYNDCFRLIAEIIEIKDKPSLPIGEVRLDAFGDRPRFVDKGIRKRALCAIGKQDVGIGDIIPDDEGLALLGASSDHLILDVTDCDRTYKVGDLISFRLTYGGILRSMTSEYVAKQFE